MRSQIDLCGKEQVTFVHSFRLFDYLVFLVSLLRFLLLCLCTYNSFSLINLLIKSHRFGTFYKTRSIFEITARARLISVSRKPIHAENFAPLGATVPASEHSGALRAVTDFLILMNQILQKLVNHVLGNMGQTDHVGHVLAARKLPLFDHLGARSLHDHCYRVMVPPRVHSQVVEPVHEVLCVLDAQRRVPLEPLRALGLNHVLHEQRRVTVAGARYSAICAVYVLYKVAAAVQRVCSEDSIRGVEQENAAWKRDAQELVPRYRNRVDVPLEKKVFFKEWKKEAHESTVGVQKIVFFLLVLANDSVDLPRVVDRALHCCADVCVDNGRQFPVQHEPLFEVGVVHFAALRRRDFLRWQLEDLGDFPADTILCHCDILLRCALSNVSSTHAMSPVRTIM
jgi:hypothetical protein